MIKLLIITLGLLIASVIYRSDSGRTVKLAGAPELSGAVAQSMYAGGGKILLPTPGKDFNLKNINYFDNRTWAVATVVPVNDTFNGGVTILKSDKGVYRVVVPPSSQLPDYSAVLPKDVVAYLKTSQPIYEPVQ